MFLDWIENSKAKKVTDNDIQNYLFYCEEHRKYAFSTMKQVIAAISFLYLKVFYKPVPKALEIKLRKPTHLPTVLSVKDINKILDVTKDLKHKTNLMLIYSGGLRLSGPLNAAYTLLCAVNIISHQSIEFFFI